MADIVIYGGIHGDVYDIDTKEPLLDDLLMKICYRLNQIKPNQINSVGFQCHKLCHMDNSPIKWTRHSENPRFIRDGQCLSCGV